ncbi:hypothetical protein [Candidatus Nitrosocosmicus franklandus]|uniref:Uncharacterized protein n=1 Tax=Candidatus Nitrosocosmicus franklandianus TaxID=1798806 RepID=A0A484IET7_9ARCH|nr:hypothetical protein [Candidatus Nitrosocosmicus franklandus]VFJ14659.1 conserved membrane protein of unknown function [Candidatus Nitrosocosmicus franklandus]
MNNRLSHFFSRVDSYHIYVVFFYFSAFMMLYITTFGMYWSWVEYNVTGTINIGEIIVKNDLLFEGAGKLVSYLAVFSVITWYCVTKIGYKRVQNTPKIVRSVLSVLALVLITVSAYEFVYNFTVWGSLITVNTMNNYLNVDDININYPNPETPWNLVFATKMTLAALIISCHAFFVINRAGKKSTIYVKKN